MRQNKVAFALAYIAGGYWYFFRHSSDLEGKRVSWLILTVGFENFQFLSRFVSNRIAMITWSLFSNQEKTVSNYYFHLALDRKLMETHSLVKIYERLLLSADNTSLDSKSTLDPFMIMKLNNRIINDISDVINELAITDDWLVMTERITVSNGILKVIPC